MTFFKEKNILRDGTFKCYMKLSSYLCSGYIDEAMDGGGLQELLENIHSWSQKIPKKRVEVQRGTDIEASTLLGLQSGVTGYGLGKFQVLHKQTEWIAYCPEIHFNYGKCTYLTSSVGFGVSTHVSVSFPIWIHIIHVFFLLVEYNTKLFNKNKQSNHK